jgi:hypothetical protein
MAETGLHDTILQLEDLTWKALQKDGAALIPFLSRDCIMLFPMGMKVSATSEPNLKEVMTSEAFVPWKTYAMSDVEVTPLGPDAAAISYRVTAVREDIDAPDDGTPFRALISSIWRSDPGGHGWLMVLHQQTPFQDIGLPIE